MLQILRAGLEEMISSVQMFPSTLKLDLFVTAFGVLAPEGQLIRTGGHMHHSKSAVAMSGDPPTSLSHPVADCEPGLMWTIHNDTPGASTPGLAAISRPAQVLDLLCQACHTWILLSAEKPAESCIDMHCPLKCSRQTFSHVTLAVTWELGTRLCKTD